MSQSASQSVPSTDYLSEKTQTTLDAFSQLGTDAKLALLYLIYQKMGDSITPAAPTATDPELAPLLMEDFYRLPHEKQLDAMRDIVNGADTDYAHAYGALKENNQLMVWFAWAQAMGKTVIGLPAGYQAEQAVTKALGQIEGLAFEAQISLLREIVSRMGYSNIKPIPTQAETGKTASL
ncbi:orange carotenoid protein N-terminal domain-containing protein [Stenomitos frigidus]|uniref:Orange carotenoid protein n=1 Tax=Stenomitos frigidus ULC18 TaxID=2107698 RepID=A0A2T1E2P8_9CYAN|nr:orange carotenoid protein N-terminal domain-containing protein [Stenomitos frigidus]PSB27005.1 orange carotenoid protein [Stenomitos frigidus ULC18]